MKWLLTLIKQTLARVRVTIKKQIDKHWKKMIYKIDDMMFLNSRNIMIARSSKKLNDKMLESFKILTEIEHAYWLKLSSTMKIHSKFILNLLWLNSKDSLKEQWNESSDFMCDRWRRWIKSEEHTELQTLQKMTAISCQLKRLWRWSTLIQCQWKWVQRLLEDHKWLSSEVFEQIKLKINSTRINWSSCNNENIAKWRREIILQACISDTSN